MMLVLLKNKRDARFRGHDGGERMFGLVLKRAVLLFFFLFVVAACAKEDVRESVSQSLKTMCRDNPKNCTLNDPDSARPDGKGAQK